MTHDNAQITQKQEAFLIALQAANGNITVAAKTCKINESTGRRWLKQEAVQSALKAARREAFSASMQGLALLVDDAIALLKVALNDKKAGYGIRLRAAQMILEHSHDHMVAEEIEERLATLETTASSSQTP